MENDKELFERFAKIRSLPRREGRKRIVLKVLVKNFIRNKIYSEEEVDAVIKKYFDDFGMVRRELVELGLMERDPSGRKYKVRTT